MRGELELQICRRGLGLRPSPPQQRRGGCAIKKKSRSHLSRADGVVLVKKCYASSITALFSNRRTRACPQFVSFQVEHVIVPGTIKFDNDATFRTIKVDNIRTYSVLAGELLAIEI
jgi:hypothetical protein